MQYNRGHRQHHDFNLKSAHVHVIADRTTCAVAVLTRGMLFGWSSLDPTMGWMGAEIAGA